MHEKIESDLEIVTNKEKHFEISIKEFKNKESELIQKEADIDDRIRDLDIKYEEFKLYENELNKLNSEIQTWENQHWKFKKNPPPSAII